MTTTTITPNWRRFAAVPFDATVSVVVQALALGIPPEGRPRSFIDRTGGFRAAITDDGKWIVHLNGQAQFVDGPDDVRRKAQWMPAGTPQGDALRQWLRMWGWVPASERQTQETQEQTRTII